MILTSLNLLAVSAGYNFTTAGDYEVEATNLFHYQDKAGNPVTIYASISSAHTAKLNGKLVSRKNAKRDAKLTRRASFKSCSSSRQSQITTALTSTLTYAKGAADYLNSHTSATTRYTTWFGAFSSSRRSTVLGHYQKIVSSNPQTYTYDCSCTESDTYGTLARLAFGILLTDSH